MPPARSLRTAPVRIGGASGFWGDSSVGPAQLVAHGEVDFLVFDYLAELTMAILAGARARDPAAGWATDFVQVTMGEILPEVLRRGIRVVSNAGGLNPQACAQALGELAAQQGLQVRVAVVTGDDVLPLVPALRESGDWIPACEGMTAQSVTPALACVTPAQAGARNPAHAQGPTVAASAHEPPRLLTANAYLGALPIRAALDAGAQVVITGRCVDSAVTLGALMHAFDWPADDYDRLAQGSLAGHILECGCQATGGLHTDWEAVPDWAHIGYPVLECHADGSFVASKPPHTGGLVNTAVIAEQLLYEIGDPRRYLLPDVGCDFSNVRLQQVGEHRVHVSGARGVAPGPAYKVSATLMDGYRCTGQLTIVGLDAARKAQRTGEAILERTRELFAARGWPDYSRSRIEVLGSERANFGPHARTQDVREAVLQVAVAHPLKQALELFAREIAPAGTSWSPGTTGAGGRPKPTPCIRQAAFFVDKRALAPQVRLDGVELPVQVPVAQESVAPAEPTQAVPAAWPAEPTIEVPLLRLAWARSGDKGDVANIGVIARRPEWLPWLRAQLTEQRVKEWLAHLVAGEVHRFDLPGIHAMNFVCTQALDGGGMASLRNDPLGKGMAQILLSLPVRVPAGFDG